MCNRQWKIQDYALVVVGTAGVLLVVGVTNYLLVGVTSFGMAFLCCPKCNPPQKEYSDEN